MKLGYFGGPRRKWLAVSVTLICLTGCAKQPQVRSDALPVKKVVVYRNGVAYFERAGEVDDPAVQFQLRQENVGDFLATLAIMESGGHSVRTASFPVSLEEEQEEDPELRQALESWERKQPDPRKLRQVTLALDGESHDLTVGYLAETPLWRPSYRLVIAEAGQASLQVWGIVQNQSGEDWRDIELSLVAGAPIAFESTLGEPVIPRRPIITDEGEVIQDVPQGATAYHQEPEAEAVPEEAHAPDEADDGMSAGASASGEGTAAGRSARYKSEVAKATMADGAPSSAPAAPSPARLRAEDLAARSLENLAQVEVQSGSTRYVVPYRVTVPDRSATMVLLVSRSVPGEAVHLYAPDPGVSDSQRHPFRVARFKNESGGLLEKGPIAIFEEGAFLGQGMLASLPVKAEATVPFALVRDVAVEQSVRFDERGVRFYAVRNGALFIERDQATLTSYRIQNGDQEPVKLLLKHPRAYDSKLFNPPKGTQDSAAERVAFVPVEVPKFGKKEVMVEERRPMQTSVPWESVEARQAMTEALAASWTDADQKKRLGEILEQSEALAKVEAEETKLRRTQQELEKSARETRLSLSAIENNPRAAALRQELTSRLRDITRQLEEVTKSLVESGLQKSEKEVRLQQAKRTLEIPPRDAR